MGQNALLCALVLVLSFSSASASIAHCARGDASCWPTAADIASLTRDLEPDLPRVLKWDGPGTPRISGVPIGSPDDQPLYGLGTTSLSPVYIEEASDLAGTCFTPQSSPFAPAFCLASTRNYPYNGWTPSFVVWPLKAAHVQAAVRFATHHRLCIMVAGTGHDFLNRHSCDGGVFIRTSLMKEITWDLVDAKGFGHAPGNVRFGPGIVWSEAHKAASDNNRVVSSGWAATVGVVGWSIGGGHGPFAPSLGLGVDNILEVELVTANASLVTVNAKQHHDLFWALRGGGGSTWGVITAITLRAHPIPSGGFGMFYNVWTGSLCDGDGVSKLDSLLGALTKWTQGLGPRYGGLVQITPEKDAAVTPCGAKWAAVLVYCSYGPVDAGFNATVKALVDTAPVADSGGSFSFPLWWQRVVMLDLEPLVPVNLLKPEGTAVVGGLTSVVVPRAAVADNRLAQHVRARLLDCRVDDGLCVRQELYHCITGNIGSPQAAGVSISKGLRTGMIHYVAAGGYTEPQTASFYALGRNSYFSESAYTMSGGAWKARYWGDNYARLLSVKRAWDPSGVFACHNCVGAAEDCAPAPTSWLSHMQALAALPFALVALVMSLSMRSWLLPRRRASV